MASTFKSANEYGDTLTIYCSCGRSEVLDLDSLADSLGWEFDYVARRAWFLNHLVCKKCGARNPELIVGVKTQAAGMGAGHSVGNMTGLSMDEVIEQDKEHRKRAAEIEAESPHPKPTGKNVRKFGR